MDTDAQIQAIIEYAALDRVWFCENVLNVTPDPWQQRLMKGMDQGDTRISCVSGHGTGKTFCCALVALHFLLFRPGSTKIILTSPSSAQLKDGIWAELVQWIEALPSFLRDTLEIRNARVVDVNNPDNRFISMRTARIENPESLAGVHAANVLIIADEASGIPAPVWEAAAGTLSTIGSIAVLIGNPTRTGAHNYFWRTQNTLKDHWTCYQISCLDSPRVSDAFVADIERTYGRHSAQFAIRVLGQFADLDEDRLIPREMVESAIGRDVIALPDDDVFWGVDVGRGGDASALVCRKGQVVTHIQTYHLTDLMQLVGRIKEYWDECRAGDIPENIYVDSIGLGAGVADRLRELGLPTIDVNVSESPALKERYPRLRDELWYTGRDFFEARKCHIPDTPHGRELMEELASPVTTIASNGKAGAESKKDLKARGIPSPNIADAFLLTLAFSGAAAAGRSGHANWSKPISRNLQGVA